MSPLDDSLLNEFQRDFPLVARPYAEVAARLGTGEDEVLAALARLMQFGAVSRVGGTFAPGRVGAATLAALSVPAARLQQVAELVSAYPQVNHNYQREHHYNLWFVITAGDARSVERIAREIGRAAGCGPVLQMTMVEPYKVDLGFDMSDRARSAAHCADAAVAPAREPVALTRAEATLAAELQEGLPLVARPYAALAGRAGMTEATVMSVLRAWLANRVLNRLGIIVRHHELGYVANAMVVWDVPDADVREAGHAAAAAPFVTLCYRRLRQLPDWRYNLYCMIHGRGRDQVQAQVAELRTAGGLTHYPFEVLFSCRRFKQSGARYLPSGHAAAAYG